MATVLLPHEPTGSGGDQYVWRANKPISASLVARLSEAADGIRNGKPIYFVAELVPDPRVGHDVMGYFNSVDDAYNHPRARLALETSRYMIFGPYRTDDDPHYKQKDVLKVVIYRRNGDPVELDGTKFDCIFWSLSAMEKFVIPYYMGLGGIPRATQVRADFVAERSVAGIHIPGSDIVNEAPSQQITGGVSTTAGLGLEELRDRVGLYQMVADVSGGGQSDPKFIPL